MQEATKSASPELGAPDHTVFRRTPAFGALDGLRALSILAVLWHHRGTVWPIEEYVHAARYGFLGVDLFFLISGFLIVTLLLRERETRGAISLPNFYARRSLRILPLYYGLIIVTAVGYLVAGKPQAKSAFLGDLPVLFFFLSNWIELSHGLFRVSWSLAAEEQFYLLWPPIERWLKPVAIPILLTILILGQVIQLGLVDPWLLSTFGWDAHSPSMLRETTFTPICLGVLLAHVLHQRSGYDVVLRVLGAKLTAPIVLGLVVALCSVLPDDIRGVPRLSVHLLLLALLASCLVREDHGLRGLLGLFPLRRLGVLSYGVYLLHQPAVAIARRTLPRFGLTADGLILLVGWGLTLLLAELSFRYYEAWFLRFRGRFR